ncbi:uncharacterized protein DFL_009719 [Arthrobotrys flagrans]|uniref:Uncharacterized protein n=1 Tax=Arthrobotrys flagrans TaxID=97331 RepID=A0A436ZSQ1_ARTFL|nr:hypothetical protein DFL_009719 [Arthrobotrys flagrans]
MVPPTRFQCDGPRVGGLHQTPKTATTLKTPYANFTDDRTWVDFRTQYFNIISPLTTEWYPIDSEIDGYHMQRECRVAKKKLKNSYKERIDADLTLDVPPGIMDCGGRWIHLPNETILGAGVADLIHLNGYSGSQIKSIFRFQETL